MKDNRLYLIHITECIERIERYTAVITLRQLFSSPFLSTVERRRTVVEKRGSRLRRVIAHPGKLVHLAV